MYVCTRARAHTGIYTVYTLKVYILKVWKELNDAVWRNVECIHHLSSSFTNFANSSATQSLCKAEVNFLQNGWMHRNFNTNLMCMHLPQTLSRRGKCLRVRMLRCYAPLSPNVSPYDLALSAVYSHTQFSVTALNTWIVVYTSKVCATAMLTLRKVRCSKSRVIIFMKIGHLHRITCSDWMRVRA
jgi:hypothetical protein